MAPEISRDRRRLGAFGLSGCRKSLHSRRAVILRHWRCPVDSGYFGFFDRDMYRSDVQCQKAGFTSWAELKDECDAPPDDPTVANAYLYGCSLRDLTAGI